MSWPRIFSRRSLAVPPQPTAEPDWLVGDVGECIIARGRWFDFATGDTEPGPARGELVRVVDVFADHETVWLIFREFAGKAFPAGHFRKLRPGALVIELGEHQSIPEPELVP
jgi:hypothetical protein